MIKIIFALAIILMFVYDALISSKLDEVIRQNNMLLEEHNTIMQGIEGDHD